MSKLLGLPVLCILGLLAGGCSHGAGVSAYAGPAPGYGHAAMVEEGDGDELPPVDEVLPRPMYGYPGYVRSVRYHRGGPTCPGGMSSSPRLRRCISNVGRDVESPEAGAALAACVGGHIQKRYVWKGSHYVEQQRAVGCHRSTRL